MMQIGNSLKNAALVMMASRRYLNVFDRYRMASVLRPLLWETARENARFDAGLDVNFEPARKLAFFTRYELPRIAGVE